MVQSFSDITRNSFIKRSIFQQYETFLVLYCHTNSQWTLDSLPVDANAQIKSIKIFQNLLQCNSENHNFLFVWCVCVCVCFPFPWKQFLSIQSSPFDSILFSHPFIRLNEHYSISLSMMSKGNIWEIFSMIPFQFIQIGSVHRAVCVRSLQKLCAFHSNSCVLLCSLFAVFLFHTAYDAKCSVIQ